MKGGGTRFDADIRWSFTHGTSLDSPRHRFLSTIEGRRYPVYGVQYHPEVVQWDWTKSALFINRSVRSIAVSAYLGNFFVREARKYVCLTLCCVQ